MRGKPYLRRCCPLGCTTSCLPPPCPPSHGRPQICTPSLHRAGPSETAVRWRHRNGHPHKTGHLGTVFRPCAVCGAAALRRAGRAPTATGPHRYIPDRALTRLAADATPPRTRSHSRPCPHAHSGGRSDPLPAPRRLCRPHAPAAGPTLPTDPTAPPPAPSPPCQALALFSTPMPLRTNSPPLLPTPRLPPPDAPCANPKAPLPTPRLPCRPTSLCSPTTPPARALLLLCPPRTAAPSTARRCTADPAPPIC